MTRLRFDANLKWLFTDMPFVERFDAAARAGFAAVEYASPYAYEARHLRALLDNAGLEQILINTPMGPAGSPTRSGCACFPDLVDEYRDGVLSGLEYAAALDAKFLHVVGGIVPKGVSADRAFARYVANIAWAAEQARGTGIRLLLEAQNKRDAPGFLLASQAQAAAVVEAVGDDVVGLLLDFYHVQIGEGDLVRTFEKYQDITLHLQIADVPDRHEPGTGEIAYSTLFRTVESSGYDGWIGCEYQPATDTVAGLTWMKELAV
ncbi:hydroxypyruvate isomerase [Streptomyces dioscori]|uniref:Hydroxypyruvate isomerase n=1 Tax=Streptomyces dioscori TaxID=2109333 RepID=A0A2P8Q2A6_9ACTN|nr:TIM barrel protein [Streptomyces dioscori]PSM40378.1 hydroxypyruvate isomerase [Streptomyces dioscori]